MNKKYVPCIICLIFLLVGILFLFPTKRNNPQNEVIIQMNTLLECSEYHAHQNLIWDMSPDEVSKIISIQKDDYRISESYVAYNSESECIMNGRTGQLSFEFADNQLNLIQFYFQTDDCVETWFEEQIAQLRGIYGNEKESRNISNELLDGENYRWDFDDTSLQFAKMTTNKNGSVTLVLSIGKLK